VFQDSKLVLYYFSEDSQVCKVLIQLTPKDCVTYLTFQAEIIRATSDEAYQQLGTVNFILDANKQALKKHWGEKIAIVTANFIMVQIFIEGLKWCYLLLLLNIKSLC
jgi:hypothetical protein